MGASLLLFYPGDTSCWLVRQLRSAHCLLSLFLSVFQLRTELRKHVFLKKNLSPSLTTSSCFVVASLSAVFLLNQGLKNVAQAGFRFLDSSDHPTPGSQVLSSCFSRGNKWSNFVCIYILSVSGTH